MDAAKPTVCFVHGDALDLFRGENGPRFGGSETQIYQLARTLAATGEFGVRLVADNDVAGAEYPGISFASSRAPVRRGLPYLSRFVNRRRVAQPYRGLKEAVLIQTILGPNTVLTWRAARQLGFKFVYRMSCDADIDGSFFPPEVREELHEALKDADGIIAQTEEQKQRLSSELGVDSAVVRTIVDIPEEGPATSGHHVLWAGRGAAIKRPWIMIETARCLPNIKFLMLMPKEVHFEGQLFWRCVVQEAEHIPNLTIVPGVPYFEMAGHYRDAAIFANTSAIEGVPSVFLQSAAQGTPIVSLDVDVDGELARGHFGRHAGGDIDEFREAIAGYMNDPEMVHAHGEAAFDYARSQHSPEAVQSAFSQFIRDVLNS